MGTKPSRLAVDLGKTSCRMRLFDAEGTIAEHSGPGAPGIADAPALSVQAIRNVYDRFPPERLAALAGVGIGAAGVEADRGAARQLASEVREFTGAPVALINDALAAHAGTFAGGPGVILVIGTGAIAYAVAEDGATAQFDGWGPWLGDEGSGRWIGQEGLAAALRAFDGRGPHTALTARAAVLAGDLTALPAWVAAGGNPARRLGLFTPDVLEAAADGDPVARDVVRRACSALTGTARASGAAELAVWGGVTSHPYFSAELAKAFANAGITIIAPLGNALDGAALITARTDLGYEERIIRG
ncbi:ATPase [Arthrobacter gandavensis]|uniref:N-acetylglucosamine kinase n=1 Tax=Arthrobacter gandavensis TaxID=169960 RepID=UPI00188EED52|nr:BadF/BadG/BcrA/BcrD ATPase family protein [Arthrobacter gandavensis]MBF4992916.1 ATPase [Arthrobacter gandavensis]